MTRLAPSALLALLAACRQEARPPARPVESPPAAREPPQLRVRAAPARDDTVDATFDQEARGARPVWLPPPDVWGAIDVTLDSLTPAARRCFAHDPVSAVDVRLTLAADGRASDVVVETLDARARDCLADSIRGAAFPPSRRAWRIHFIFRF